MSRKPEDILSIEEMHKTTSDELNNKLSDNNIGISNEKINTRKVKISEKFAKIRKKARDIMTKSSQTWNSKLKKAFPNFETKKSLREKLAQSQTQHAHQIVINIELRKQLSFTQTMTTAAIDKLDKTNVELATATEELAVTKMKSGKDKLTGLYTRGHFDERLTEEISNSSRHGRPLSLIILDIDYFKKINDTHGHLGGDQVLEEVARRIKNEARSGDIVSRYGGEEIAIICPSEDIKGAATLAERIRQSFEKTPCMIDKIKDDNTREKISVQVTLSGGVSCKICDTNTTPEELIHLADNRLYAAKNNGRNRVNIGDSR